MDDLNNKGRIIYKNMGINKQKFSLAAMITMALAYGVCTLFVAILPELSLRILGWLVHLVNVDRFVNVRVTFGGFIVGLLPILFYSYAGTWIFVSLYNSFIKPKA